MLTLARLFALCAQSAAVADKLSPDVLVDIFMKSRPKRAADIIRKMGVKSVHLVKVLTSLPEDVSGYMLSLIPADELRKIISKAFKVRSTLFAVVDYAWVMFTYRPYPVEHENATLVLADTTRD